MGYRILEGLLTDTSDITLLTNLSNDKMDKPELLNKIMAILDDKSPYIQHIESSKILSLFRMAKEYFNTCWSIYLDTSLGGIGLDKLVQYSESTVYWVYAPNGERVATEKEVENGVEQLNPKVTYVFEEEVLSSIYMLLWTFSGHLRYYKKSGLSFTYTGDKLDDTDYQLVCKAGQKIRGMIDWVSIKGNYERAIAVLKLAKKNSKYKYPSFATDEIAVDMSTKQVLYVCKTNIIGRGSTQNQIEAKKTMFKMEKNKYKPTPYDISVMRKACSEIKDGLVENPVALLDKETQYICDRLAIGLKEGMIDKSAFVFKIVGTIQKTGKCSEKQLGILKEAEEKMNKQIVSTAKSENKNKKDTEVLDESMEELLRLSEALGSGVLEV